MASLKIKFVEIDGEKRVPPLVMKLLCEFAEHRRGCFGCEVAFRLQDARAYCEVGHKMMDELVASPDVELLPD